MAKMRALLLLGPTGSGKSPLGDRLEARGLWSVRCAHFDFGANLRAEAADFGNIKAGDADPGEFTSAERAAILNSLATGALL
jgi:adenylate kinase